MLLFLSNILCHLYDFLCEKLCMIRGETKQLFFCFLAVAFPVEGLCAVSPRNPGETAAHQDG